jgi:2-isopropylmalate synthase
MSYTAIMGDVPTKRPPPAGDGERSGDLIFDWNELNRKGRLVPQAFALLDETLRDGLQNPSVEDPSIDDKLRILHLMDGLKIEHANIGLPGSSKRAYDDVLTLCKEVAACKMGIRVACAGRTVASDITPILDISQKSGVAVEVCAFIGSSPIRQFVEQWDVALIAKRSADAIDLAVGSGLPVSYVTEDTTRSRPEVLSTLFRAAIDHGATRIVLTDTVGHATPDGVRNLVQFTRALIASTGAPVGIDWHGHNDRGLALGNALWALEHGADRVHGTALGIGERVGNPAIELILLNLRLLGQLPPERDLTRLVEYCEVVARAVGWDIPLNYPLVGRDSFRTATGVHAAAIIKALQKGDAWLADRVYSGVPAGTFGRRQEIAIGFMSGASNVAHWLRQHGIEPSEPVVESILELAKGTRHLLSDDELLAAVDRHRRTS